MDMGRKNDHSAGLYKRSFDHDESQEMHMSPTPKILIVEDDPDISSLIDTILKKQGYETVSAFSGTEACLRLQMGTFDLMILDLMLPGMTGDALLLWLREEKRSQMPVLVLSAKAGLADKVQLLTSGADDYMTKPFEPEELLARIISCLRRIRLASALSPAADETLRFRELELFVQSRRVLVCGQELSLTPHEFEILLLLLREPAKVYSRESLYEQVWNGGYYGEDNTVNVHVL